MTFSLLFPIFQIVARKSLYSSYFELRVNLFICLTVYIIEMFRYSIVEEMGCMQAVAVASLDLFIFVFWPVVLYAVAAVYCRTWARSTIAESTLK